MQLNLNKLFLKNGGIETGLLLFYIIKRMWFTVGMRSTESLTCRLSCVQWINIHLNQTVSWSCLFCICICCNAAEKSQFFMCWNERLALNAAVLTPEGLTWLRSECTDPLSIKASDEAFIGISLLCLCFAWWCESHYGANRRNDLMNRTPGAVTHQKHLIMRTHASGELLLLKCSWASPSVQEAWRRTYWLHLYAGVSCFSVSWASAASEWPLATKAPEGRQVGVACNQASHTPWGTRHSPWSPAWLPGTECYWKLKYIWRKSLLVVMFTSCSWKRDLSGCAHWPHPPAVVQ